MKITMSTFLSMCTMFFLQYFAVFLITLVIMLEKCDLVTWRGMTVLYAGKKYKLFKHSWHAAAVGFTVSDIYRV